MSERIDFIVIGAPKAGTTALYEYLSNHPKISMPPSKELPFFNEDRIYKKGIHWYSKQIPDKVGAKRGTITPQYTLGSMDVDVSEIAERMKKDLDDDVKLIALFNDPLKRAFSHYKMAYRRGYEKRPFEEAIADAVQKYKSGKLKFDYQSEFLYGSLYGTAMKEFYSRFPSKNIQILFGEDLRNDPANEAKHVADFIGAKDKTWKPQVDADKEIHKGGMEPKFKLLTPKNLKKIPGLFAVWNNLVPYAIKKRVDFGINKWNIKPDNTKMEPITNSTVLTFFAEEIQKLEKLSGVKTPWKY